MMSDNVSECIHIDKKEEEPSQPEKKEHIVALKLKKVGKEQPHPLQKID